MERWQRGTSTAIGTSGHVNEFRAGVLVGNFVEDAAGREFAATGRTWSGAGAPFRGVSTQRVSYNEEGKTGEALAYASQRADGARGVPADLLMRHGDYWAPRATYFATLNQLTYSDNRYHGEPRTDHYTWSGGNIHDRTVPRNTMALGRTTERLRQAKEDALRSAYATTTRTGHMSAALPAAENPSRTQTIRITTGTGHESQVGRKPLGPHRDECDKTYRRTGLRDRWYSGNIA